MDLERPSRLLDPAHERAGLLIRRWMLGEVVGLWIDASEAKRRRYAAMTRAGRTIRHEAAVRPRKRFDRRAGMLQALAKRLRRYLERLGALGS